MSGILYRTLGISNKMIGILNKLLGISNQMLGISNFPKISFVIQLLGENTNFRFKFYRTLLLYINMGIDYQISWEENYL